MTSKGALRCTIEMFDSSMEDISTYLERFELFVEVNSVKDTDKVKYLLAYMGPKTYSVLKTLCIPDAPPSKTFDDLSQILKKHFSPGKLESVERLRLRSRRQGASESITEYILALKAAAKDCGFGAELSNNLRDQLVYGVKDIRTSRRLLSEANLTFDSACAIALSMEVATSEASWMANSGVHAVTSLSHISNRHSESNLNRDGGQNRHSESNVNRDGGQNCFCCGRSGHWARDCFSKNAVCHSCGKSGHISRTCRSGARRDDNRPRGQGGPPRQPQERPRPPQAGPRQPQAARGRYPQGERERRLLGGRREGRVNEFGEQEVNREELELDDAIINGVRAVDEERALVPIRVNGMRLEFEIDTGAPVTLISEDDWRKLGCPVLSEVRRSFKSVSGSEIKVKGECEVVVGESNGIKMNAIVCESKMLFPLLGRTWMNVLWPKWKNHFGMNCNMVNDGKINVNDFILKMKSKYPNLFESNGEPIEKFEIDINLLESAKPMFQKAYSVPYAIENEVKSEIDRLVEVGVLEKIEHSQWGSPLVVVRRGDGRLRLCFDYKKTLNPQLLRDTYKLPVIEDIFAKIGVSKCWSVLDLKDAYQQLMVHETSRDMLTINTLWGTYRVNRVPYGLASAPQIFQRVLDSILQGIPGVQAYLDDILIGGTDEEDCKKTVEMVLCRLSEYNVSINVKKCQWFKDEINYLGHRLTGEGVFPSKEKVKVISEADYCATAADLISWLGFVNYYHKYLPSGSGVLKILYDLAKCTPFKWTEEGKIAFNKVKKMICESRGLTFFDPEKPMILTCDSSQRGIGSVLSHVMSNGEERPIYFFSAALTEAQKGYSQLERESLAIVLSIKKFHKFLYGRKFLIRSDHKPLQYIFAKNRNVPAMTAAKLQRWALFLANYDYDLIWVKGKDINNADGLSRNPVSETYVEDDLVLSFTAGEDFPLNAEIIATETKKDPVLSKVIGYLKYGNWPNLKRNDPLWLYFSKRIEMSLDQGCLLRGHRVVVPATIQQKVLDVLHEGHPGIVRMKHLARSHVWWPNVDQDLEVKVQNCDHCQESRQGPAGRTRAIWSPALKFWERVHIDFLKKEGVNFLLLVDAYSGWVELWPMSGMTAQHVIDKLRGAFTTFSLPELVISDNGPPFSSAEFRDFLDRNGVAWGNSPQFHPSSNGICERHVRSIKEMLTREMQETKYQGLSFQSKIENVLFNYRTTPRACGKSPFELVFKTLPRTKLSLLRPQRKMQKAPLLTKQFFVGEEVWVRLYTGPTNYGKGEIVRKHSPTTYWTWCNDLGRERLVHVNDLKAIVQPDVERKRLEALVQPDLEEKRLEALIKPDFVERNVVEPDSNLEPNSNVDEPNTLEQPVVSDNRVVLDTEPEVSVIPELRRTQRRFVAPTRLNL